ncbi:hypothetical protein, partial [Ruminococcus sp.]
EESAPPTADCLRQPEESSTMIVSFSLHNSCSNKMCQVILTKPRRAEPVSDNSTQSENVPEENNEPTESQCDGIEELEMSM